MKTARAVMAVLLFLMAVIGLAQAQDRVEVFGGYAFTNTDISPDMTTIGMKNRLNAHGWEATAAFKLTPTIALKGDVGGGYANMDFDPTAVGLTGTPVDLFKFKMHSFLFGPQLSVPVKGPVQPWAQFLLGGANGKIECSSTVAALAAAACADIDRHVSDTVFAMKFGGGVDVKLNRVMAVRTELGLLHTRFNTLRADGTEDKSQNHVRLASGLVFKF